MTLLCPELILSRRKTILLPCRIVPRLGRIELSLCKTTMGHRKAILFLCKIILQRRRTILFRRRIILRQNRIILSNARTTLHNAKTASPCPINSPQSIPNLELSDI